MEAELKNIEANLTAEFGTDDRKVTTRNSNPEAFYCIACDKIFQTYKAFTNHENSKRHKENVSALKHVIPSEDENLYGSSRESDSNTEENSVSLNRSKLATDSQMPDFLLNHSRNDSRRNEDNGDISPAELMSDNEENSECPRLTKRKPDNYGGVPLAAEPEMDKSISFSSKIENDNDNVTSEDELISDQEEDIMLSSRQKKKKRKRNSQNSTPMLQLASDDDTESINEEMWLSKKQRKKLQQRKVEINKQLRNKEETYKEEEQEAEGTENRVMEEANVVNERLQANKAKEGLKKEKGENRGKNKKNSIVNIDDLTHRCVSCSSEFPSKNKLFEHLKKTRHSVYIPELTKNKKSQEKKKTTFKGKDDSDKKKR